MYPVGIDWDMRGKKLLTKEQAFFTQKMGPERGRNGHEATELIVKNTKWLVWVVKSQKSALVEIQSFLTENEAKEGQVKAKKWCNEPLSIKKWGQIKKDKEEKELW